MNLAENYRRVDDIDNIIVDEHMPLRDALSILDSGAMQILLVVNWKLELTGVVTDGDVRRYLIQNDEINGQIGDIAQSDFVAIHSSVSTISDSHLQVKHLPVLDDDGRPSHLYILGSGFLPTKQPNKIIIMAGGLGMRMRPLTENTPKPMLCIGDKPLLAMRIESLVASGFTDIYISVNYKKDAIIKYFEDGSDFGCSITYLEEEKSLGTGGALSLIEEDICHPVIVMNGDLMSDVSINEILDAHKRNDAVATVCARLFEAQVPFGVLESTNSRLSAIVEKPTTRHLINAGIYALSPSVFDFFSYEEKFDLPDLLNLLLEEQENVNVHLLSTEWMDIGTPADLELASRKFGYELNEVYKNMLAGKKR